MNYNDFDVIISGAGPTGLLMAIDLGQRGVRTLLLEKNDTPGPWPKMERTNPRSMEIMRRLGIAEEIRSIGYPAEASMDILIGTTLGEEPLSRLKFPTVAEYRELIASKEIRAVPLEPYQLVSQYDLEPLLVSVARATPYVTVLFGCETISFEDAEDHVTVHTKAANGTDSSYKSQFLVACDGGSSPIRKTLGIPLLGEGRIRTLTQVQFCSERLYEEIRAGKGRHYLLLNGNTIVVQGNRKDFTLHTMEPEDSDFEQIIKDSIGMDIPFEILRLNRWNHNLLVAERFRKGRVFLAGDAAHLLIPNGGLGMNTSVGDAATLAWQLAATVHDWAGESILDAYESERRPVALFNIEASRWATEQLGIWKREVKPEVFLETPEGTEAREALREIAHEATMRSYSMIGAELGYLYFESPLVVHEADSDPTWEILEYNPRGIPGERLPMLG